MSETLKEDVHFIDGTLKDPRENIDLAWAMAHAEKPFQDAALESKRNAELELDIAKNSMSEDLTTKVERNKEWEKSRNNGSLLPIEAGGREKQVSFEAQKDQEKAINNAEKYIQEVKELKALAAEASQNQLDIYERLKKLEHSLSSL